MACKLTKQSWEMSLMRRSHCGKSWGPQGGKRGWLCFPCFVVMSRLLWLLISDWLKMCATTRTNFKCQSIILPCLFLIVAGCACFAALVAFIPIAIACYWQSLCRHNWVWHLSTPPSCLHGLLVAYLDRVHLFWHHFHSPCHWGAFYQVHSHWQCFYGFDCSWCILSPLIGPTDCFSGITWCIHSIGTLTTDAPRMFLDVMEPAWCGCFTTWITQLI